MPEEQKNTTQQLHAFNASPDIREALEARVKDPFWFLARQWQTGEFEAENGGRPANISIETEEFLFQSVTKGKEHVAFNPADPLDAVIEAEDNNGTSACWNAEALEFECGLKARNYDFEISAYDGRNLDWHDFRFDGQTSGQAPKNAKKTWSMVPNQISFPGAPDPRWWAIEEGDAYFENPDDPEPNVLSLMLPEFAFMDINNWYIVPAPTTSGCVRVVKSVVVVDSFGVVTTLGPVVGKDKKADWAMFAIDGTKSAGQGLDGSHLVSPNVAIEVVENDVVEEVRFMRDENANLVWAWEHQIVNDDGKTITTNIERPDAPKRENHSGLPEFTLKTPTARAWIPYVPTQKVQSGVLSGQIGLRRGRTDEGATKENPQYRSKIVAEARVLMEEQVPPIPLRIRRLHRYARGADGKAHFWTGRDREVTSRMQRPGLKFDYLEGN